MHTETTKKSMTLMEHIEQIVLMSRNSGLQEKKLEVLRTHTDAVATHLAISGEQAILLSALINFQNRCAVDYDALSKFFNCQNIRLMCMHSNFVALAEKKMIKILGQDNNFSGRTENNFAVMSDVIECLKNGKKYVPPTYKNFTPQKVMNTLGKWFDRINDGSLRLETMNNYIEELMADNPEMLLFKQINKLHLTDTNRMALLYFCHRLVNEMDNQIYLREIRQLDGLDDRAFLVEMKRGKGMLFAKNLVEFYTGKEMNNRNIFSLTKKAMNTLLKDYDLELETERLPEDLTAPNKIVSKELYFNEKVQSQIDSLTSLLRNENFKNVQKRLEKKGMRRGFACLFYGAPGTGKTETAYQLARLTKREIMMVDIAATKSMWFGESEKLIKGVFCRYKSLLDKRKPVPILLFNEADAIFGKRMENTQRSVDQTSNAIQNIILQEMEILDGIMIATTNLTGNLDKAFERRFLYKVEFDKPGVEAKSKIWQSMLPNISEPDAHTLAQKFDFSGGQIENISRKSIVNEIINGGEPNLDYLIEQCQNETLGNEKKRIGFGVD